MREQLHGENKTQKDFDSVKVHVPGDKSITQRVLILAALASGESRLRGLLHGGDVEATACWAWHFRGSPQTGANYALPGQGRMV
ncbi:MAG TPA: hypothetical protein EYO30_04175 [Gemmatimonadetes bacterium]|nr:hypothetical protein [Gemmatimonadota bacterium]